MLLAQSALNGLTDEQRQAIVTLSKNDEETVIGNRFREVYNRLDETIARETGIARDGDEKTYNYLERAAKALAAKANSVEGLNTKIHDLTAERDRLKKAIEENTGDEKLKKDLAQAVKDLDAIKNQYTTLKADYDKQKNDHAAELLNFRIDNEIAAAKGGIKFKAELPETATSVLLAQAVGKVKALKHEFIDDGNGGQRLVFKDANDAIMRNAEKQLEPYTIGDLLVKELKLMGVVDEGRQQQGTGTKPPTAKATETSLDVSMARTQTEADEIIHQQLNAKGLVRGSKAYEDAKMEAWKAYDISKLPMQ